ncbi:putative efflux pump antibiotic resistance protein [Thelonectria olida]|uniref:Efflux pump antibiotic resistance protein n=1 Tax=Thelonectria olida TaxID=1576542 RepID=A0A9P8VQN4_9HYPO|nr:putative efflux pump antibiotic resistance protein [Thelonectria olida]
MQDELDNIQIKQGPSTNSSKFPQEEQDTKEGNDGNESLAADKTACCEAMDATDYPTGIPLFLIVVGLCLAVFIMGLDNSIIATAIPKITDQFSSLGDIGWYGSAYFLTTASLQLFFGKMYGIFSIKLVFLGALFLFEVGSLICGVAPNSVALIIGRAIAGMGSAGILSGGLIILSHSTPLQTRPIYTGIAGSMYGISSVAGPLLGGFFTDKVTWRWCFYINLPIGAITVVAIVFCYHDTPRTKTLASLGGWREKFWYFDPLGTLFFMPMVICLLLALQWAGTTYEWHDGRIIVLLVLFAVLLVAFVTTQLWMGNKATVPPRLFKISRTVWSSCLFAFCVGGAFFPFTYFIPFWFQAVKGTSAVESGIRNLPMLLGSMVFSLIAGFLVPVISYSAPFMIAGSVLTSVGAGLITTWAPGTPSSHWIGYQVIMGAGAGCSLQQTLMVIQTVLTMDDIPTGTSLIAFLLNLGGAIFMSVGQNLFSNKLVKDIAANVPGLDLNAVVAAGATGFRKVVSSEMIAGVVSAYNEALVKTFQMCTGLAAAMIIGAVFVKWISVKGKHVEGLAG